MPARDILFTNGCAREWDMENDSGSLRSLNVPFLYDALQPAVGETALLRRVIQNHVWTDGDTRFAIHISDESKVDA